MKKIILSGLILLLFLTVNAKQRPWGITITIDTLPTSELISYLTSMNLDSFRNKSIDSFLVKVPANVYNQKVYNDMSSKYPAYKACFIDIFFTPDMNGPSVRIWVKEFTHMNRVSSTPNWDFSLFRKENIWEIDIYKNPNTCINGGCRN
jgi:hypothetical protein